MVVTVSLSRFEADRNKSNSESFPYLYFGYYIIMIKYILVYTYI